MLFIFNIDTQNTIRNSSLFFDKGFLWLILTYGINTPRVFSLFSPDPFINLHQAFSILKDSIYHYDRFQISFRNHFGSVIFFSEYDA